MEKALSDSIGFLTGRIATALRTELEHDLSEFGVTANQWPVLLLIHHGRASRPSEIAEMLGIDRGAATRLIDRLEQKGVVSRFDDPGDLRAAKVQLTERGRTLTPVLETIVQARNEAALAEIDPAERAVFLKALKKLDAALHKNASSKP